MSTPTAPVVPPRTTSVSGIALVVLLVAVLGSAPSLLAVPVWMLHQPWITVPALLIVAVSRWRPAHTKRALFAGAALAHQQVTQRRQAKTSTA